MTLDVFSECVENTMILEERAARKLSNDEKHEKTIFIRPREREEILSTNSGGKREIIEMKPARNERKLPLAALNSRHRRRTQPYPWL